MDAKPARLDADGSAKPLTRIIDKRNPGHCFGPGIALRNPYYESESGVRISLKEDNTIVPSEAGETHCLFMTPEERNLVAKLLVKHSLLSPEDKSLAIAIRNKIQG